jgi:hypothetical protein
MTAIDCIIISPLSSVPLSDITPLMAQPLISFVFGTPRIMIDSFPYSSLLFERQLLF